MTSYRYKQLSVNGKWQVEYQWFFGGSWWSSPSTFHTEEEAKAFIAREILREEETKERLKHQKKTTRYYRP